jgi:hypothetical protein
MALPTVHVQSPAGDWTPGRVRSFWLAHGVLHALVLVSRWDRFGHPMQGVQAVAVTHLAALPGQDYAAVPGAPDGVTDMLTPATDTT